MRWDKWVHESLEIRPPPLRQGVTDLPLLIDALAAELGADGGQPLVQPHLEAFYLLVFRLEIISWELEERVGDLQH